jgi:hypothetical protein
MFPHNITAILLGDDMTKLKMTGQTSIATKQPDLKQTQELTR